MKEEATNRLRVKKNVIEELTCRARYATCDDRLLIEKNSLYKDVKMTEDLTCLRN